MWYLRHPTMCDPHPASTTNHEHKSAAGQTNNTAGKVDVPQPPHTSTPQHEWLRQPDAMGGVSKKMKLLRKEVIQPHLPVRLPCYDFVPIANPTFDHSLP